MSAELERVAQQQKELDNKLAADRARARQQAREAEELAQRLRSIEEDLEALDAERNERGAGHRPIGLGNNGVIGGQPEVLPPRPGRPDPNAVYRVELGNSHAKGSPKALVTVVMWTDYQCPFSRRVQATLSDLQNLYGKKIRFVQKHNPLPMHRRAMPAAIAAEAAGKQGKFWEMHQKLWRNNETLSDEKLEQYASELGLDLEQFRRDFADRNHALQQRIERQQEQGNKLGARGTPAFFINGRFLSGAQPLPAFQALIDEELQKARKLVREGTSPSRVYDKIIEKGKTKP